MKPSITTPLPSLPNPPGKCLNWYYRSTPSNLMEETYLQTHDTAKWALKWQKHLPTSLCLRWNQKLTVRARWNPLSGKGTLFHERTKLINITRASNKVEHVNMSKIVIPRSLTFWLEENVSRAVGQNFLTPKGEHKTHKLPRETITWTFDSHVIRSCSLKPG